MRRRLRYSTTFWPQSSVAKSLTSPLKWMEIEGSKGFYCEWRSISSPLKSLSVHNSMGPDETHPRVLTEQADAAAKPLFMIFEKLWQPGEYTVTWKRETLYPSWKIEERKTLGTMDLSVPPPCLERPWNRSSWNLCRGPWRTRKRFKTTITTLPRASPCLWIGEMESVGGVLHG